MCRRYCCLTSFLRLLIRALVAKIGPGKVMQWCTDGEFLPAALRAAQICRYLVYSEADFEVFRPAGATRCTDGVKFGMEEDAKFHPHRCNDKGVGPPKLKFLLRFDRNVEYKRPAGAYPLRDFHKICIVCTSL